MVRCLVRCSRRVVGSMSHIVQQGPGDESEDDEEEEEDDGALLQNLS